jgi:asparagine synthase (glutamine-hydrolysing)
VFDQHDLSPELYATRFDVGSRTERHVVINRLILALLLRCERETYLAATRVIATNNSYRRIAIERGGLPPDDVVVVRNGPDPDTMYRRSLPSVARPDEHLVVWMGNMGPQDGVDDAIRAVSHLVHEIGRTDARFLFIGRGEVADEVRALSHRLELDDYVTFTGWIPDEEAFDLLSLADVGLSADPPGPLNDKSTMIKTLEYMAFGLPIVAHDLHESRVSAGPAAVYANSGDARGLARCLDRLLSEPDRMAWMGNEGRLRIERGLSWPHQARAYVELWSSITGHLRDTPGESSGESVVVSIDPAWSDSADRSPVERQEVKL